MEIFLLILSLIILIRLLTIKDLITNIIISSKIFFFTDSIIY